MIEFLRGEIYFVAKKKTTSWKETKLDFEYHMDDETYDVLKKFFFIPNSFKDLSKDVNVTCDEPVLLVCKKSFDKRKLFTELKLILP